jgi:hypothetical protein
MGSTGTMNWGDMINVYKILVKKPERKKPLGRHNHI